MDRALRFTNQPEPLKPVMGPLSSVMHSGKCITASPSYQPTSLPQDKGKEGGKTKGEGILLHYQKDLGRISFCIMKYPHFMQCTPHIAECITFLEPVRAIIIHPRAFTFSNAFGEVHYGQHKHLCSAFASPSYQPTNSPPKTRQGREGKPKGRESNRTAARRDACRISLCYMEYPYFVYCTPHI